MNGIRYLLPLLLFAGAFGCNTSPTPVPIVVGHVADKSRLDKAGEQAELGIRLALYELTKDPKFTETLAGRAIQVRHTDARDSLEAYEAEAVRLVNVNKAVALLGGLTLKESAALDQAQVPVMTFHGQRSAGASKHVFYVGMSPTAQGEALAKFVAEDAKIKRVVLLIDERRPESSSVTESFQSTLANLRQADDVKFLTLRFGEDAKWTELVVRIANFEPEAIVFAGGVADFNAWHPQHRRPVFRNEPLLVFAGDDGVPAFDLDREGKTSVVLATAFMPVAAFEKTQTFAKAYRDAFQSEPDVHAALAYDGFRILADAIKKAQPLSPAERFRDDLLKELLKTKEFDGVTGPLAVNADRQVVRPLFIARWQAGKLTHVKTVAPAEKKD